MIQFLVNISTEVSDSGGGNVAWMCGGADVLGAIKFVMIILDAVFIIVPIILILLLIIDFAKNVIAKEEGDMKKNLSLAIKRLVMCIALFLVVPITHTFIRLVGEDGQNFITCFNIAINRDVSGYSISDLFDFDSTAEKKNSGSQKYAPGTKVEDDDSSDSEPGSGDSANDVDDAKDEQNDLRKNSSSGSNSTNTNNKQNIFIGDSRTHGMELAIGDENGDIWICDDNTNYEWFSTTAMSKLRSSVVRGKKYNIFINMGVNDLGNQTLYVQKYAEIANSYTNSTVIAVSVNKVDDKRSTYAKNSTIEAFNRVLSNKAKHTDRMVYCDTYSKVSFEFSDGIHYQPSTYIKIYNAMKKCA